MFASADPAPVRARYGLGNRPVVMYTGRHQRVPTDRLPAAGVYGRAASNCPEALLMVVSPLENEPDLPGTRRWRAELGLAGA